MPMRVNEPAIFAELYEQLSEEGVGDNPWVCWPKENGDHGHATFGVGPPVRPNAERAMWAFERVDKVNKEAWLDGCWVGVWGDWGMESNADSVLLVPVPRRFLLAFKDADGAMPIRITYDEPWHILQTKTVDSMVEDAMQAKAEYRERLYNADVKPEQMDRPVIGQVAG